MAFRIKRAETLTEHEALYRIRHRIFIEEMNYGERIPDGRMFDRFDELPNTCNFIAVDGEEIIAGIRLVEPGNKGWPTDVFYDFSDHLPPGARMCVLSMLFTAPAVRSLRALKRALLGCFHTQAMLRGFTHVAAVAAPVAERFFMRTGYRPLHPRFFQEELRLYALPVLLDLAELEPGLRQFTLRHQAAGTEVFERLFLCAGEPVPLLDRDGDLLVASGRLRLEPLDAQVAPVEFGEGMALNAARLLSPAARSARLVASADAELALLSLNTPAQDRAPLASTG